jgi:hypothetical protein
MRSGLVVAAETCRGWYATFRRAGRRGRPAYGLLAQDGEHFGDARVFLARFSAIRAARDFG